MLIPHDAPESFVPIARGVLPVGDAGDHAGPAGPWIPEDHYGPGCPGTGDGPGQVCLPVGPAVDWNFVAAREGIALAGYVPKNAAGQVIGNSGVTIAAGFDLGAHDGADLARLHLDAGLVKLLTPYLGKTRAAADSWLQAHPLAISSTQAAAIDTAMHAEVLARLETAFDAALRFDGAFLYLPAPAQTALADLAVQYGSLPNRAPALWKDVTALDWSAAVDELRHFGDAYAARRRLEADLLQAALDTGRLHDGSLCASFS